MQVWDNVVSYRDIELVYLEWLCTFAGTHVWRKRQLNVSVNWYRFACEDMAFLLQNSNIKAQWYIFRFLGAPSIDKIAASQTSNFAIEKTWCPHTRCRVNWTEHATVCLVSLPCAWAQPRSILQSCHTMSY